MLSLARCLLAAAFFLGLTSNSFATTIYFLPGDAYFRTTISEKFLERQESGEPLIFHYRPVEAFFCGESGTGRLHIADENGKLLQQLRTAYAIIRQRFPQRLISRQPYKTIKLENGDFRLEKSGEPLLEEANELYVFCYNADFNLEQHRLLHLYNEDWQKQPADSEIGPQEIVSSKQLLKESLENGHLVSPLKVLRKGSPSEEAHLIPDGELQIVIVPMKEWLQPVAHLKQEKLLEIPSPADLRDHPGRYMVPEIYIIKSDGIYRRQLGDGKWSPDKKFTYEDLVAPTGPQGFF